MAILPLVYPFITFIPFTVSQTLLKSLNSRRRRSSSSTREAFNWEKWWLPIWNRKLWIWCRRGALWRLRWMPLFRAFVSLAVLDSLEISSTLRWLQWLVFVFPWFPWTNEIYCNFLVFLFYWLGFCFRTPNWKFSIRLVLLRLIGTPFRFGLCGGSYVLSIKGDFVEYLIANSYKYRQFYESLFVLNRKFIGYWSWKNLVYNLLTMNLDMVWIAKIHPMIVLLWSG